MATGTGFPTILRSGAQAISHAKCTSSNVDTAETACSLYYSIFSWPGCPTSQPTHTLLLTSQSCQPKHALLWRALVNFVAIVQLISCHGSHCLLPLLWGQPAKLPGQPDTTAIHKTTVLLQNNTCTYFLPVIYIIVIDFFK